MASKIRGEFYSVDVKPAKYLTLFYQETEPSLFQIAFNQDEGLEKQKAYGLQYENSYSYNEIDFRLTFLYQRAFDQVEYDFASNTYENFQKVENAFLNLLSQWKSFGLYVQLQNARNLESNEALPRRSPLSFGLDHKFRYKGFLGETRLAWHSKRKSFDNTDLPDFMTARLALGIKGFRIVVNNVLNQDIEIYKSFRRKPFTMELNYLYKF